MSASKSTACRAFVCAIQHSSRVWCYVNGGLACSPNSDHGCKEFASVAAVGVALPGLMGVICYLGSALGYAGTVLICFKLKRKGHVDLGRKGLMSSVATL